MSDDGVVTIDHDTYDYVIDKGPLVNFTVANATGELQSLSSLRIFGLRKGFSEFADLPGHYLCNVQ